MLSLTEKLQRLEKFDSPEKISIRDLRALEGYPIISLRKTDSVYGPTIAAEIYTMGGDTALTFLPKRFLDGKDALTDAELDEINRGGYRLRSTGMTGRSINVVIYK